MRLYRDTESSAVISEAQVKAEFEAMKAEDPQTFCKTAQAKTDFWRL